MFVVVVVVEQVEKDLIFSVSKATLLVMQDRNKCILPDWQDLIFESLSHLQGEIPEIIPWNFAKLDPFFVQSETVFGEKVLRLSKHRIHFESIDGDKTE